MLPGSLLPPFFLRREPGTEANVRTWYVPEYVTLRNVDRNVAVAARARRCENYNLEKQISGRGFRACRAVAASAGASYFGVVRPLPKAVNRGASFFSCLDGLSWHLRALHCTVTAFCFPCHQ